MDELILTTSWDDGHPLDLRTAELLGRYNLRGTFYVARDYLPERLSAAQMIEVGQQHEIGAHTLTHPVLTQIPLEAARREISGSREWLQDITGKPVSAFCYPKGRSNPELQATVREAGYRVARGVEGYRLNPGDNPYDLATTIHVYPFPLRPIAGLRGIRARIEPFTRAFPQTRQL